MTAKLERKRGNYEPQQLGRCCFRLSGSRHSAWTDLHSEIRVRCAEAVRRSSQTFHHIGLVLRQFSSPPKYHQGL